MKFEEFDKFSQNIKKLDDPKDSEKVKRIVDSINIDKDNFNNWVDSIFSEKINDLDIEKLPYIMDLLYKSDDKLRVYLFCMLLEATSDKLPFITNLEDYPLYEEKYKALLRTLVLTFESCNNGIGNCMALIILKNDPEFKYLDDEGKEILKNAILNKLKLIIDYLKNNKEVHESVYNDLEIIIDIACYLKSSEINKLILEIDKFDLNDSCNTFVIKYKVINDLKINLKKIDLIIENQVELEKLFNVLERIDKLNILPLEKISQEMIARSALIKWLMYPTELGCVPDEIELLTTFDFNNETCYAFKFKSNNFIKKDFLLGISGGYKNKKLTSINTGLTFSKFEEVQDNFMDQAIALAQFISDYWKNRK